MGYPGRNFQGYMSGLSSRLRLPTNGQIVVSWTNNSTPFLVAEGGTTNGLGFTSSNRLYARSSGGQIWVANADNLQIGQNINHDGNNIGFYSSTPAAQPTITGSRGGNAALADLLTELETLGLVIDSTS